MHCIRRFYSFAFPPLNFINTPPSALTMCGSFNIFHPPFASSSAYAAHDALKCERIVRLVVARALEGSFK